MPLNAKNQVRDVGRVERGVRGRVCVRRVEPDHGPVAAREPDCEKSQPYEPESPSLQHRDLPRNAPRGLGATISVNGWKARRSASLRGGWKSVVMVLRYEHVSEERDALLAQALKQFAETSDVVSIASASPGDRVLGEGEGEGKMRRRT